MLGKKYFESLSPISIKPTPLKLRHLSLSHRTTKFFLYFSLAAFALVELQSSSSAKAYPPFLRIESISRHLSELVAPRPSSSRSLCSSLFRHEIRSFAGGCFREIGCIIFFRKITSRLYKNLSVLDMNFL